MRNYDVSRVAGLIGVLAALSGAQAQVSEIVLRTFALPAHGGNPRAGVVRDSSGNLYGTASYGVGTEPAGVVYKVDPAGVQTILHNFTGGSDGGRPYAGVTLDASGNLYGTTCAGGSSGQGVVYRIDRLGNETVLYNFTGGSDGGCPWAGVTFDSFGNLYGTTKYGGTAGFGVVYKLGPMGRQRVLHTFGNNAEGGQPETGVALDANGNLYGTVGLGLGGLVYKLDPAGHETVMHQFTNGSDGGYPAGGVILDTVGNVYGTAAVAGAYGSGLVYKLSPIGKETVLYNFTGGADGGTPYSGLAFDAAGNLYGTTYSGGTAGLGVVYQLCPGGAETTLHSFTGPDGWGLYAGVTVDGAGNLYGTTYAGGNAGLGVVYQLAPGGTDTVLYNFPGPVIGGMPYGGAILDSAGNVYGTTSTGGSGGAGIVYKFGPDGRETVLHNFTGGADGGSPNAVLMLDSAGSLYGTTPVGGAAQAGVVFKLDTSGNETVLHNFTGGADGGGPTGGVVLDSLGNLYGATESGGADGMGVVYELNASGNETVLHAFTGYPEDGQSPYGGVILDAAGNLYGTTLYGGASASGTVYELDTGGNETVLHSFTSGGDGLSPAAGVILDSSGSLYGTTVEGGVPGFGTIYRVDTSGNETVLYSFTGGVDGATPTAGLMFDLAGNLYGTTSSGGASGLGTVFELSGSGVETVLHNFTGGADGQNPYAGVTMDAAGNLYGTTAQGGRDAGGTIFKMKGAVAAH